MDAPTNPRPIRYSTRPYGRFGSFFEAELGDEPLPLRELGERHSLSRARIRQLQERALGPLPFVARFGFDWLGELLEELDPFAPDHVHCALEEAPGA